MLSPSNGYRLVVMLYLKGDDGSALSVEKLCIQCWSPTVHVNGLAKV